MQDETNNTLGAFIEKDVRSFIAENLTFSDDPQELDAEQSMLEADIIDSTSVLELVAFLEEHFKVKVEDSEIVPDNLDTLNSVVNFVEGKIVALPGTIDIEELCKAS